MKQYKNKHRKLIFTIAIALLVVPVFALAASNAQVNGLPLACQSDPDCVKAAEEEAEAKQNASQASSTASAYQAKVDELAMSIDAQEKVISDTKDQIKDLRAKIKETEVKLKEKRQGLIELLVKLHIEGSTEPIKILASSNSISDLAEKASRSDVAKQQITAAAETIRNTKEDLEEQRTEVENLLEEQKDAQEQLVATQAEQQELVNKYQNDAAAYEEVARAAQIAQQEAMQRFMERNRGTGVYYGGGGNTYPYRDQCPARAHRYWWPDDIVIGGYICECVSYTAWKVQETYGYTINMGNANTWDNNAPLFGFTVDRNPTPGSVGQIDDGEVGHVFWVESVNADGSINISEYNNSYSTGLLTGDEHWGDYGTQTISAAEVPRYKYIHF